MLKKINYGPLFVISAAFLWSLDGLLRRYLYTLPATVIVFWEHVFGALIILPFCLSRFKEIKKLKKLDWLTFIAIAFFSSTLATIFYTSALGKVNYIQYSVVVLLQQLQPIFAISLAAILLKEKITPRFLRYAFLAIVGAYLVSFKELTINLETGAGTVLAAFLALGAGVFWGTGTVLGRYVLAKVGNVTATGLRFWLTVPIALGAVFATQSQGQLLNLNQTQWLMLLAITLSTGMVAMLIYYYGLKRIEAKVSTVCELFWPVSAVIIGFFYLKEVLTLTQIIGSFFILYSIYQISFWQKAKKL